MHTILNVFYQEDTPLPLHTRSSATEPYFRIIDPINTLLFAFPTSICLIQQQECWYCSLTAQVHITTPSYYFKSPWNTSLVPRPHPLTRKVWCLVTIERFLGCTMWKAEWSLSTHLLLSCPGRRYQTSLPPAQDIDEHFMTNKFNLVKRDSVFSRKHKPCT